MAGSGVDQRSGDDAPGLWAALRAAPLSTFLLIYLLSLVACLTIGLLYGFRPTPGRLDADEQEYYALATQIIQGSVELSARRTLGFPIIVAAIRSIADDFLFLQVAITALYALTPPLMFLLVRKVGRSDAAGIFAGVTLALWPPAIFYGTSLYSETLAAPIFLLALLALPLGARLAETEARGRAAARAALASGVLLGIATHVRPMYLLFVPFMALIVWIEQGEWRGALRRFALVLAGFLALILPWSIVQSTHFHRPIVVTFNGGETLAGGLNPQLLHGIPTLTTPSGRMTWMGPGKWIAPYQTGYLTSAETNLPYHQQDAILRARTLDWAVDNPGSAALIQLRKISYMWGIYPIAPNGWRQILFGNLPTLALLLLAIGSFATIPDARRRLARFWTLPLFVTGIALISWGSWRFRQPGDAGLIAFCAICLTCYGRDKPAS